MHFKTKADRLMEGVINKSVENCRKAYEALRVEEEI